MSFLEVYVEQAGKVKSLPELFQVVLEAMFQIGFEVKTFQLVRGHECLRSDPTTNQWPVPAHGFHSQLFSQKNTNEDPILKRAVALSGAFFVNPLRMRLPEKTDTR